MNTSSPRPSFPFKNARLPCRRVIGIAAMCSILSMSAAAGGTMPKHPWLSGDVQHQAPSTYFVNLTDGQSIETPYVLKFGLARFGMAPISKPTKNTGHHHLLVNRDLPMNFKEPLPFNDQYIHFGKGQMETVLNFPPGEYTLRLLLADDKHIPHFIYSKPVRIKVAKKYENIDPKTLITPSVQIVQPPGGIVVRNGAFKLGFHASGYNVGHSSLADAGVGHFRLVAERVGHPTERITFDNGATEAWLTPPPGDYKFRVELVRNSAPSDVMAISRPVELRVEPGKTASVAAVPAQAPSRASPVSVATAR